MDQSKAGSSNRRLLVGIIFAFCCICALAILLSGLLAYFYFHSSPISPALPLPSSNGSTEQPPVVVTRPPAASVPLDTETTLNSTVVHAGDLYDLACRLKSICNVPHTLPAPVKPFQVGDQQKFWIANVDTNVTTQITATLDYITPHTYFWAQNGVQVNQSDMKALMDSFENKIYPTDHEFFGTEWTPGVDNDPHIYIVYARGTGASNAGYFSTPDEYNPLVHKYSNGHEMFVFNADNMDLGSAETYSVLAHEFQHMIRWNVDPNQSDWMNEGFSVLAEYLNGYPPYFDYAYITHPDLNLSDWLPDPGANGPHYGESFLFLDYFLDRFGVKATQALAADPVNNIASVDDTLSKLNLTDPQTGKVITADDVTLDWMVAMYLQDGKVGDGRYVYHNYPDAPKAAATATINTCPQSPLSKSVNQYGAEYIEIHCTGNYTLSFEGSTVSTLLPADPHSGKYMFWSNMGDSSDMTLTRDFDLTNVTGPAQLSYWTWYDLEQGYDYLYLEVSTDGQSWQIIKTPSCFSNDTSGNAYGCGYTGMSGGGDNAQWLNESVDLSQYDGRKIQLRFEYITDAEVNGNGFALDDVSMPAINYSSDFEADSGGWQANGFARVENVLPQTFRLALIVKGNDQTTVQNIALGQDNSADIPLSLKSGESAVLVVTGVQRFTRQTAGFTISVK